MGAALWQTEFSQDWNVRSHGRVVTGQDSAVTIRRELLKDGNYAVKDRQSCQRTSMVMLQGGQSGNGAVTSGQSCHRKGLVLSHAEQS